MTKRKQATVADASLLAEALAIIVEFVRLKDIKEKNGKLHEYQMAQPFAWKRARAFLKKLPTLDLASGMKKTPHTRGCYGRDR